LVAKNSLVSHWFPSIHGQVVSKIPLDPAESSVFFLAAVSEDQRGAKNIAMEQHRETCAAFLEHLFLCTGNKIMWLKQCHPIVDGLYHP